MEKLCILVSSMLAAVPDQGGWAWAVLQYLLGLRRLGHDVYFVELMPEADIQPAGALLENSRNYHYFRSVLGEFGLDRNSFLYINETDVAGRESYVDLVNIARTADILINISGRLDDRNLIENIPIRAYLDLDPAFTQLWQTAHNIDMKFSGHTHFVTIGEAIGEPGCSVPSCGLSWITTKQPIVLEYWPLAERITHDALTTIANWRGYGSAEYKGIFYGQKVHSLRNFMNLPLLTSEKFSLALNIHPDEVKDINNKQVKPAATIPFDLGSETMTHPWSTV